METCRSCGAPVVWTRTEKNDKSMPVDAEPVDNGNLELVTVNDLRVSRVVGLDLFGGKRYLSHYATCPDAKQWRAPAQQHSEESKAAAKAIAPKIGGLHRKVLSVLRRFGSCTDEEIATLGRLNPSTARPRRIELEEAGHIVRTGTGKTRSGRAAAKWGLTQQGREAS